MPVISMFYGLLVSMYFAVFSIPDGRLLEGRLPAGKTKLLLAWIEIHQEELMANWALAINGQPIFKIDPLK